MTARMRNRRQLKDVPINNAILLNWLLQLRLLKENIIQLKIKQKGGEKGRIKKVFIKK
jgi:hypothetical protein